MCASEKLDFRMWMLNVCLEVVSAALVGLEDGELDHPKGSVVEMGSRAGTLADDRVELRGLVVTLDQPCRIATGTMVRA